MTWSSGKPGARRHGWVVLALLLVPGSLMAQRGMEVGLHVMGTAATADFVGAGPQVAFRPGGRERFVVTLTPGVLDGDPAFRGELLGQFLLNPRSRKTGFYAGGGLAGIVGAAEEGYVVLLIGVESHPGGRSGWMLEAGIGGGVRVLAGYRWRRLRH